MRTIPHVTVPSVLVQQTVGAVLANVLQTLPARDRKLIIGTAFILVGIGILATRTR